MDKSLIQKLITQAEKNGDKSPIVLKLKKELGGIEKEEKRENHKQAFAKALNDNFSAVLLLVKQSDEKTRKELSASILSLKESMVVNNDIKIDTKGEEIIKVLEKLILSIEGKEYPEQIEKTDELQKVVKTESQMDRNVMSGEIVSLKESNSINSKSTNSVLGAIFNKIPGIINLEPLIEIITFIPKNINDWLRNEPLKVMPVDENGKVIKGSGGGRYRDGAKEIQKITGEVSITSQDSPSIDAFSRLRTSDARTIFDSKLTHTNEPEFWDDQQVSGATTTSVHNPNRASVVIGVALNTVGKRVRQTFSRPNYQPGKSQMVLMTGILGDGESGITREIGQFDDENGLFFRNAGGVLSIVRKTFVTGSAVDVVVEQDSWNLDKMDGTGKSKITMDFTKTQIFVIDYQWLGVGRVRYGFDIDGLIVYFHEILNANNLDAVYISNPNNPLRYSIENDGTGSASTMECICSAVISEGGQEATGTDYWYSTSGVHVDANVADTIYAIVGVRLQTGHKGEPALVETIEILTETNDNFEWILLKNPTVAGTFTYADEITGPFQSAKGVTANTVTGGESIAGGWGSKGSSVGSEIDYEGGFGEAIDGTRDEFVLCVRPLSNNADIQGGIKLHINH